MSRSYAADLLEDEGFGRTGLIGQLIPQRRSDLVMALVLIGASAVVLTNALALQKSHRSSSAPAPSATQSVPLPVPAPEEVRRMAAPAADPQPPAPAAAPSSAAPFPVAPRPPSKPAAPPRTENVPGAAPQTRTAQPSGIGALASEVTGSIRPPADVAVSPRVMDVQKALAKLGYGPIRIDGRIGVSTQEAIQRFERDRRLPITGEISDKMVQELNAVSGMSIH
ncbi:peptidoglycan-binding domain-containing protein [Bosea sp. 117]|uniref:peptidoglycan-binding domain-containing protein n=1 Tax=Bosea sp. 117 TaxID=1125973 RepID=UPI000493C458|nr:peptidoglycan-binding domain-containing protein [Bosea sp. 117]